MISDEFDLKAAIAFHIREFCLLSQVFALCWTILLVLNRVQVACLTKCIRLHFSRLKNDYILDLYNVCKTFDLIHRS